MHPLAEPIHTSIARAGVEDLPYLLLGLFIVAVVGGVVIVIAGIFWRWLVS